MKKYMKEMFVAAAAFFATSAGPMVAPAQAESAIPFEMIKAATEAAQREDGKLGKYLATDVAKNGLEVIDYEKGQVQVVCGQGEAYALTVETRNGLLAFVDKTGEGDSKYLLNKTKNTSVDKVRDESQFKKAADQYCRMENGLAPAARGHMVQALLQAAQNGTLSIAPAP